MTAGSAHHDALWAAVEKPGELVLKAQLNLVDMLRPAVQPGSRIDYEWPVEDVTVFSGFEETDEDPADEVWRAEEASELVQMVRGLPPDQQRVLVLKFSHGLKNREIGDLMGRSEGATKVLIHRAIKQLEESLEEEAGE